MTAAGAALRDARKRAGMTLRDASRFVDVHFSYLSKVENGHERPGDYLVMRLCNLYGMDPEPMLLERAIAAVAEPVRAAIAARAVDEALSVGEVVRMLEGIRRAIEVMGEDGECSLRTIRGVQYVTKDDAMLAVDDYLGVMRFRAAALVAHLRGPRDG